MTESEMNRIAEMVVDKIIARQKAYDEEFKAGIVANKIKHLKNKYNL